MKSYVSLIWQWIALSQWWLPSGKTKPEYNHALVAMDKYTRYQMAYPLKSIASKAVCECLLDIFMTYSNPRVISSDCRSNFTSQLTTEFSKRLGYSPRFKSLGHPECAGLVKCCNSSLETAIIKLCKGDPESWEEERELQLSICKKTRKLHENLAIA